MERIDVNNPKIEDNNRDQVIASDMLISDMNNNIKEDRNKDQTGINRTLLLEVNNNTKKVNNKFIVDVNNVAEDNNMKGQDSISRTLTLDVNNIRENNDKNEVGVTSKLWSHRKQLVVLLILIGIITYVVYDVISENCLSVEKYAETSQRLYCAGELNATDDNFLIDGQTFSCTGNKSSTSNEEGWYEDANGACVKNASCLSVGFDKMLDWISENPGIGWIVTVVAYAALTVALIPGSVLTIGSGLAFGSALGLAEGILVGSTAVIVGATLGSVLAFLMGRFLLKEWIDTWSYKFKIIKALDTAFIHKGLQFVLLLRLSPIVPFNIFNFIMGSSSISFKNYFFGTFFGIIPGTVAFVSIGALLGSALGNHRSDGPSNVVYPNLCETNKTEATVRIILLVVGIVATILAVILISKFSYKQFLKLKKQEEEEEKEKNEEEQEEQKQQS